MSEDQPFSAVTTLDGVCKFLLNTYGSKTAVAIHALTIQLRLRARHVNARTGLAALPMPVVQRLAEYLAIKDRFSLTRVSCTLRKHLLASPELWSRVTAISAT